MSYGSEDVLERCLARLATVAPSLPVAIREHGPGPIDHLLELAGRHTAPVRVSHDPGNPGFGAGCNALARESQAVWLVFLNPDTEVVAWPWSDSDPPRRSIVGATMVDSGPEGDHAGRSYRLVDEIARSWLRRRGPGPDGTGFVSGAALLIEADAFDELGGFDERYFMFYEDIDLCRRGNAAGLTTVVAPDWIVRHARSHSTSARFAEAIVWSYESGTRFHAEQGESPGLYRAYVVADSLIRSLLSLPCDRRRARGYLALARRAASDLTRRRPPGERLGMP